jgi:hypothetical protein
MVIRLRTRAVCTRFALTLATMALALILVPQWAPSCRAQGSTTFPPAESHKGKERPLTDRLPDKPSLPLAFSIPVEPLGFSAPGPIYLGQRNSLVSLDFLDENRLLFTFRVPGLMHRDEADSESGDARQIRAVVLALPTGNVTAEALWTVHDRVRYLWMLKDGHFLLRDREALKQGDATLELKPLLHFPGPLLWLEMDPSQQFLVTNSREPAAAQNKPGDVPSPAAAQADVNVDGDKGRSLPELVVRILRRSSGQVMLVSRTRMAVHLPINSEGYIETLRGNGEQWTLNMDYFSGGTTSLGRVSSACAPTFDFVSQQEVLVTACDNTGGHRLVAMTTDGHRLWEDLISPQAIWPMVVMAPDGSSLARETLTVNHAVNAYSPLDAEDIKGQLVRVFDAASGKIELETQASPPLDAGGNVAISPSGRRVAVLHAGAIEVFDLPTPAAHTDTQKAQAGH